MNTREQEVSDAVSVNIGIYLEVAAMCTGSTQHVGYDSNS